MIFIAEVITVAKGTLHEKMICSHELMAIFGNDEKSEPGDNVLMAKRAEEAATGCSVHQTELAGLHVVSIYSLSLWPQEEWPGKEAQLPRALLDAASGSGLQKSAHVWVVGSVGCSLCCCRL